MLTAPENYKSSAGVKLKFLIRNKRVFPFKRIYVEHIEWNLLGHLHDLMRIIWIKYKSWKPYIYWWWHESRITKKNNKAAVTVTASWMLRKSANRVGNRSDLFFFYGNFIIWTEYNAYQCSRAVLRKLTEMSYSLLISYSSSLAGKSKSIKRNIC